MGMTRFSAVRPSLLALLAIAACSTNPAAEPSAACIPATPFGGGEQSVGGTHSVTANLVDETGAAVAAGQPVFIAGLDIVSDPGATTAGGAVSISTSLTERKPAFKFGDALNYAEFGIPLTALTNNFTATGTGKIATAKLAGKPGAALTPGTDAVSGDVTVALAANAAVGIDELVYGTADEQKFRAVSIPLTNLGPVLSGAGTPTDFALVYGIAPAETTICPAAKISVSLPSTLGWAPGSAVEFWMTSLDVGQTYAPFAGWALMSDGTVSADGKTATTTTGFTALDNFAVRLK
jgi:hypothetical protein